MWLLLLVPYLILAAFDLPALRKSRRRGEMALWGALLLMGLLLALAIRFEVTLPSPVRMWEAMLGPLVPRK